MRFNLVFGMSFFILLRFLFLRYRITLSF